MSTLPRFISVFALSLAASASACAASSDADDDVVEDTSQAASARPVAFVCLWSKGTVEDYGGELDYLDLKDTGAYEARKYRPNWTPELGKWGVYPVPGGQRLWLQANGQTKRFYEVRDVGGLLHLERVGRKGFIKLEGVC